MPQSFNSFTGFHSTELSKLPEPEDDFQFLHRIPLIYKLRADLYVEDFQFLHRIPQEDAFLPASLLRANIFQFLHRIPHRQLIQLFANRENLSIPSPDSTMITEPPTGWRFWQIRSFNSFTGFHEEVAYCQIGVCHIYTFNSFTGFHRSLIPHNFGFI